MTSVKSTSLKVVSIAAVFWACFRRLAMVLRMRVIGTRSSRAARGRSPGTLGTLPAGPGPLNGPMPVPGNTAQYDAAMNLMSRAQYAEAAAAFRGYADANPGDTLRLTVKYFACSDTEHCVVMTGDAFGCRVQYERDAI